MKGYLGRGLCAMLAIYPLTALAIPVPAPAPAIPTPYVPAPSIPAPYVPSPYVPAPFVPAPYVPSPYVPAPFVPAPYVPSPYVPAPFVPAPDVPSPSVPAPSVPAPYVPSPSVPAPSVPSPQVPVPVPAPGRVPVPVPAPGHIPVPVPGPGNIPVPAPGQVPVPSPYLLMQARLLSNANLPVMVIDGSHQQQQRPQDGTLLPTRCFNEMNRAGVRCCSSSSYDSNGVTHQQQQQCVSPCRKQNEIMSFELAALMCIDIGMHMCSNEELTEVETCAHDGACPYDGEYVWTSSTCSAESTTARKHPKMLSAHKPVDSKSKLPALRLRNPAGVDVLEDLPTEERDIALAADSVAPSLGVVTYGCSRAQSAESNVAHFDAKTGFAGARCCTFDGMMCTSVCHSSKEKMVRGEAEKRCEDVGARLCTVDELTMSSICCESQCGYDTEFVWTSQLSA